MAVAFSDTDVSQVSLISTESWELVDLDDEYGSLPSNCSGAMLVFINPSTSTAYAIGAREYENSNFTNVSDLRKEGRVTCYVKCDSSHRIQIWRGDSGILVYFVGYFTTDGSWRSAPADVTPGTTGSWQGIDLSGYTSNGELFAVLEVDAGITVYANFRYYGSSDDRTDQISCGHFWVIMPLDGSDYIEAKIEGGSVYLVGFITAGTKRTSGGSDLFATLGLDAFEDITLPDSGKEIALLEVFTTGAGLKYDLRPYGGTSWPDMYYDQCEQGGIDIVKITSDKADAKIENGILECYCWGYLEEPDAEILKQIPDSGSGADSISQILNSLSISDIGSGAEQLSGQTSFSLSDAGSGSDAVPNITVNLAVPDTGSGADLISQILNAFILSDTGSAADSIAQIIAAFILSDSGAGIDSIYVNKAGILKTIPDSGSGSDTITGITVSLSISDTAAGADLISQILNLLSISDSSIGTDSISISQILQIQDAGSGLDDLSAISVSATITDAGQASDLISQVLASLILSDTGSGTEVVIRPDLLPEGRLTIIFTAKKPVINFSTKKPNISFTSKKPKINFQ